MCVCLYVCLKGIVCGERSVWTGWEGGGVYKIVDYCVMSVWKLRRALNVGKMLLKCFLYSVCKDKETIAYKVFTNTKRVVVWSVLSPVHISCHLVHPVILSPLILTERRFSSLNSAWFFNSVDSLLRRCVGAQTQSMFSVRTNTISNQMMLWQGARTDVKCNHAVGFILTL